VLQLAARLHPTMQWHDINEKQEEIDGRLFRPPNGITWPLVLSTILGIR